MGRQAMDSCNHTSISLRAVRRRIEFVEIRPAYDPSRSGTPRAASCFLFLVAEKEVAVEVHDTAVMTRDGKNLSPEKTKIAVRAFLENEVDRLGTKNLPGNFLDELGMDSILRLLGWPSRFCLRSVIWWHPSALL